MSWGQLPSQAIDPKNNPRTQEKVELGRLLFFDPILSSSRRVACATCHNPRWAWTDGRATPIGVGGKGLGPDRVFDQPNNSPRSPRNTPTLLNVGFIGLVSGQTLNVELAPLFWDSRIRGLEQQALVPIGTHGEMLGDDQDPSRAVAEAVVRLRSIPEYIQRFQNVFGPSAPETISADRLGKALAAFERTLLSSKTPFDRYLGGDLSALTPLQTRGLIAFQKAGCQQCHGGPMLSDFETHVLGVPDADPLGREAVRTPSLRNVTATGPYMHNGVHRSLREVLKFYDDLAERVSETLDGGDQTAQPPLDPLLRQLQLDPEDFEPIESFLDAVSSADYDHSEPTRIPSGLPRNP